MSSGVLVRLYAGVFAVGHAVLRAEGHYLAAVLACGPGAALSYRAAGALQQLSRSAASVMDVTSPRRTGREKKGVRVHRGDRLLPDETTVIKAVPCTTVSRTLLDLAVVVDQRGIAAAVEEAERIRVLDLRSLTILLARHRGRRGTARLRAALEGFDAEVLRARSEPEARLFHLVVDRGLPRPLVNRTVVANGIEYEVDLHWPGAGLVVEVDSSYHDTTAARERDARRDADLAVAGWVVKRVRGGLGAEAVLAELRSRGPGGCTGAAIGEPA